MTDRDWQTCTDIREMFRYLGERLVNRKARLFVCACCLRFKPASNDPHFRRLLDSQEQFADGLIGIDERERAFNLLAPHVKLLGRRQAVLSNEIAFLGCRLGLFTHDGALSTVNSLLEWVALSASRINGNDRSAIEMAVNAESEEQTILLRDIFGNPFRPTSIDRSLLTENVTALAESIYNEHRFEDMPILADALEDGGCTNDEILSHCRNDGPHVRGCWVVDLLLGKE